VALRNDFVRRLARAILSRRDRNPELFRIVARMNPRALCACYPAAIS
jgi:hypothetical protein